MSITLSVRRTSSFVVAVATAVLVTSAPVGADPSGYRPEILPIQRVVDISDSGIIVGSDHGTAVSLKNGSIRILPPLPGDVSSDAAAVNDRGDVAGWSTDPSGTQRAVVWQNGVPTALGSLGGSRSLPAAINNRGHITGFADLSDGPGRMTHAFFWDGTMHDLGPTDAPLSVGSDINDADVVVGTIGARATMWNPDGSVVDIGTMRTPGTARATGINNRGEVVGTGNSVPTGAPHAFVWKDSFTDLGTIGGPTSSAAKINDNGLVVGQAGTASFRTHAVVWDRGTVIDLHFGDANATTVASGVNNRGDVVGSSFSSTGALAVVWRR